MDNKTQSILLGVIAAVVLICGVVYLNDSYEKRHSNPLGISIDYEKFQAEENAYEEARKKAGQCGVKLP